MSDERVWNYRRGPSLTHKIRVFGRSGGEVFEFGMTIPKPIAWQFLDCKLIISISGNAIIVQSGCSEFAKTFRKEMNEVNEGGTNFMVE